jgi:hypothetical protein
MTGNPDAQQYTRRLFLVLGEFTVAFSELVSSMRESASLLLEEPSKGTDVDLALQRNHRLHTAFESLTADPIATIYFSLCGDVGDLDENDIAVLRALRRLVSEYVSVRNQIAHADWSVGWVDHETDEAVEPAAYKIRTSKLQTRYQKLTLTVDGIHECSGQMSYVSSLLRTYAAICRDRQCGKVTLRPSDKLVLHVVDKGQRSSPKLVRHVDDDAPRQAHLLY